MSRYVLNPAGLDAAVHNVSFEVGRAQALTKEAVHFSTNVQGEERCGNCAHFIHSASGGTSCQIVSGTVDATDGCAVFVGRAQAA
ncbi:MAG: hypothetical protein AAGF45_07390 [Pseudomonadota bacterium]